MARVTVYVPDKMRDEMRERPEINWSAVVQAAVQTELNKVKRDMIILGKGLFNEADTLA
jgi:post-segregation antitoxin (ccd killing protein)